MSIRTNPMKAVPTLLKRLVTVEHQANLSNLKAELINIKDLFSMVKKNEEELLDTLTVVDGYLRNSNIHKLMQEKDDICIRIRNSTQKLLPAGAIQRGNIEAANKTFLDKREVNRELSFSQLRDVKMFKVNYNNLHPLQKRYCLSLLIFPENAVMKKNDITRWWMRVLMHARVFYDKDEKDSEEAFLELLDRKLIVPHCQSKCPVVNKFKINPWIRHISMRSLLQIDEQPFCGIYSKIITSSDHSDSAYNCLALDRHKVKLSDGFGLNSNHWEAVFNVGASYLNFEPQWMAQMKNLEVLQLGRWLHDSPKHHIEVQSEEFLKELRDQKDLKYLSLRGISRIFEIPPSIFQLESLETLDLKACHNLETLPNDIASLRNLKHLDLSQCYLLDKMPKGIEKLTELEVLKGFVIGSSSKTPCRISDFANLKKLKRLSIHIRSEAVIQDREFETLGKLSKLEHLKISWGVSDIRYSKIQIILPFSLKKLHLEGFPGQNIPEWLKPSKLPRGLTYPRRISKGSKLSKPPEELTELNITGGKLKSLDHGENNIDWGIEIVRLKYLKHLDLGFSTLRKLFPLLEYVEIKQIPDCSHFEWSIYKHR